MTRAVIAMLIVASCSRRTTNADNGTADTADYLKWEPNRENPATLFAGADTRLLYNIGPEDVGATMGVVDEEVPYPDTYWPYVENGIDYNWTHTQSPLEKYMLNADPGRLDAAKHWELNNHGSAVPNVDTWWGHCPGWTAAAMANAPVAHAVNARFDGQQFVACTAGSAGCTKFEIGDINALMAEVYLDAYARFIGARCDTKPQDIPRDEDGRVMQSGCRGLNAGALVVVLGNIMRGEGRAVAIDAQNEANTDQIWNQPAYRFTVYRFNALSQADATAAVRKNPGSNPNYEWNRDARGWVFVDIGIWWVSEHGPNKVVYPGLTSSRQMRVTAIIELDGDPMNPESHIVGGEYLDDPSAGANRLRVPPFMWTVNGTGPEALPVTAGGNSHNPYLRPSLVKQLIALGQQ